ncbi:MAG: type II toxin-antitoxin system death-on-curing family toxin [Deltaproteobacteria bacterium]|nr:type II toxin-antitoxin system death-on-curing family toxin [Deltaproteobacteria bacterium]
MKTSKFPTLEEALYLHNLLIERFGGSHGILDAGLLESALARPRSGYYHSLSEQAAALLHSLTMNHCFVDGNKRVAFALTAVFLLMNGYTLKSDADETESFMLKVAAGKLQSVAEIAEWLERHMKKK